MALRTWTPNNLSANSAFRKTHELPTTVQLRTRVTLQFVKINGMLVYWPFWFVESITRESYSYVGMDAASAAICAAELTDLYTKTVNYQTVEATTGEVKDESKTMTVATVRAVHTGGAMYQVDVDREEPSYALEPMFTIPENQT
jgi:hypothetical protein